MDDQLKLRITEYVNTAYAAAFHTSSLHAASKIAETTARLAQQGVILSGRTVHEIAKIQGDHINTVVQARADALLDAYELYGAEIDGDILSEVKSLRAALISHIGTSKDSGLPPGVPALQMFQPLLDTNSGAIVNTISCQIEHRRVVPRIKRTDNDRRFEEMAIHEARQSVAEDQRVHPRVGAVVVKDGEVVSKAHRGEIPRCHAEYVALEAKLSDDLVSGATVYTTLEPCTTRNHPKIPCAQRLIERRVGRVFIGMLDPNPEIRGLGVQALNEAGIETQLFPRDLQSQIEELNREFIRAQKERQPQSRAGSLGHESQSLKIAQDAANAAKASADAVLNSERAWIEISLGPPIKDPQDDEDVVYDFFVCSIQIENHGRTVARVESVQIGAETVDGPLPTEPLNFTTRNLHSLLGSGQKETVGAFDAESAFADGVSIVKGTKRGILRIIVKYRDVVNASILHETSVLYVFQNSLEDEPEKVSYHSVYT